MSDQQSAEPGGAETQSAGPVDGDSVDGFRSNFEADSQQDQPQPITNHTAYVGVDLPEIVFGWIAILAWLVLLTSGLVVNSKTHRDILAGTHQWPAQKAATVAAANKAAAEQKAAAQLVASEQKAEAQNVARDKEVLAILANITKLLDRESSAPQIPVAAVAPAADEPDVTAVAAMKPVLEEITDTLTVPQTSAPVAVSVPKEAANANESEDIGSAKPGQGQATPANEVVLKSEATAWDITKAWIVVLAAYMYPNLALLSCISAVVGGFCRQMRSHEVIPDSSEASTYSGRLAIVAAAYTEAAMRGFVVYLTLIGGLFLLGTAAFSENLGAQDTQAQYIRLAGTMSLIAFITGYDVRVFKRALDRVIDWLDRDARDQSSAR